MVGPLRYILILLALAGTQGFSGTVEFTAAPKLFFFIIENDDNPKVGIKDNAKFVHETALKLTDSSDKIVWVRHSKKNPLTIERIEKGFEEIGKKMGSDPNHVLFTFILSHGNSVESIATGNRSSYIVPGGKRDSTVYYDSDVANHFWKHIPRAAKRILFVSACESGAFWATRNQVDVLFSSSTDDRSSYSISVLGKKYEYSFYHFMTALNGKDLEGTPSPVDQNGDGHVTILEAFQYLDQKADSRQPFAMNVYLWPFKSIVLDEFSKKKRVDSRPKVFFNNPEFLNFRLPVVGSDYAKVAQAPMPTELPILLGDLDWDGRITSNDFTYIGMLNWEYRKPNRYELVQLDFDQNGIIDQFDVDEISRHSGNVPPIVQWTPGPVQIEFKPDSEKMYPTPQDLLNRYEEEVLSLLKKGEKLKDVEHQYLGRKIQEFSRTVSNLPLSAFNQRTKFEYQAFLRAHFVSFDKLTDLRIARKTK